MSNEKTDVHLSSAGELTLRALFMRGVLTTPELPSKDGLKELRELGLAESRTAEREYHGHDCLAWLTPEGQREAIERTMGASGCQSYCLRIGVSRNSLCFTGGVTVNSSFSALDKDIADIVRETTRETLKKELEPGGLLFQG